MKSPCAGCDPWRCILGDRKQDCLSAYPILKAIANAPGGFAEAEQDVSWWPEFERNFYFKQLSNIERQSKMTAPARRRGRPANPSQSDQLVAALNFVSVATVGKEPWQGVVRLKEKWAITFNGQVSAGHPIVEELTLCPQLDRFETAIKRSGKSLVISETPGGQISVKGGKLRALVPCMTHDDLPEIYPDPNIAVIDDRIKAAFKACGSLTTEAGERLVEASVLLEANSCTGYNGTSIIQFWHGIDLPPHLVLPKLFVAAVLKQDKKLTGFGFSWRESIVGSVTFYFEDGSWIKTQCYQDRYPIELAYQTLNVPSHPIDVPTGLFEGAEAVIGFSEDEWVRLAENSVTSHNDATVGAQYEVKGLQGGKRFSAKNLKLIAPYVTKIDLTTYPDRAFFFGGEGGVVRGAIVGLSTNYAGPDEPAGTIGGAQIIRDDGYSEDEDGDE